MLRRLPPPVWVGRYLHADVRLAGGLHLRPMLELIRLALRLGDAPGGVLPREAGTTPASTTWRMMRERTEGGFVSVVLIRAMVHVAAQHGLNVSELLGAVGLSEEVLENPDEFVSGEVERKLWSLLAERGPPGFGVRAAKSLPRGAFRTLEYLVRASATFERGLERLVRFGSVLHGQPVFGLDRSEKGAWIVYENPHDPKTAAGRAASEFALSVVYRFGEEATAEDWQPRSVSFAHKPDDPRALAALFEAPILWERRRYEIELDPAHLDVPMKAADSELASILEAYVKHLLEGAPERRPVTAEVRRRIVAVLPEEPSLEDIASAMGMSGRQLQSKLMLEQTSYRAELEQIREHLARRYLERPEVRTAEVAAALGYRDASAFHRAFKRWTGQAPGAYRRTVREA